jgi:7,8-dihydropterin-6-yl-methyl-4-(beta-D-ribofuranosyl)aminobenzene 5'-phosphate synthase
VRHRLEMREITSIARTGGNRLALLMILLALSGCQAAVEGAPSPSLPSTTAVRTLLITSTPTTTTELGSGPLTSTTADEPDETLTPIETRPTRGEEGGNSVTITVIYDNNAYDPRLQTAWGFACLIERGETRILFDTGGDGAVLLSNMAALGLDPHAVDVVVLSHIHGDHTGGLGSLLAMGVQPTVYVPRSFPADFKSRVQARTDLVEVGQAGVITDDVYTTGEMGSGIVEQALVLSTARGLVVVTGCAHPGVSEMVHRAKEVSGDGVYLVLGGFHLGGASEVRIKEIIADFRELGVQKVAPCHCTGDKAMGLFRQAYGEDFIQNGVGQVMDITP